MQTAVLQEIIPNGLTYGIDERRTKSERGIPLEVKYTRPLDKAWQKVWNGRRNHGDNIYNRSRVWRYREGSNWLGIDTENLEECGRQLVSLDGLENVNVGPVHLYNVARYVGLANEKLWFLMLGNNPSGSFKDGGMVALFTQAKHLGVEQLLCASTGNTAESLSQTAANERATRMPYLKPPIVVVPRGRIAPDKLLGAIANGSRVIQIDGDFSTALYYVRKVTDADKALYVANSYNPFRIEGQKAEMLLTAEAVRYGQIDWVVTPGGNLGSASAIHKAFREMKEAGWIDRLPRLAIINAASADTLDVLVNKKGVRWNGGNVNRRIIDEYYAELTEELERGKLAGNPRHTDMSAIDIQIPADENLYKTLRALEEMNGVVISVTDGEAWKAKDVIDSNGLGRVDLASAATAAGMKKLAERGDIEPSQVVVGRITGRDKDSEKSFHHYMSTNPPIQVSDGDAAFIEALYKV